MPVCQRSRRLGVNGFVGLRASFQVLEHVWRWTILKIFKRQHGHDSETVVLFIEEKLQKRNRLFAVLERLAGVLGVCQTIPDIHEKEYLVLKKLIRLHREAFLKH